MNTTSLNPPAFPQTQQLGEISITEGGMTLRDHFAGQAMQSLYLGILSNGEAMAPRDDANAAKRAYQIADAMLAERAK